MLRKENFHMLKIVSTFTPQSQGAYICLFWTYEEDFIMYLLGSVDRCVCLKILQHLEE